jgi:transcription elongation GreA/GreB family factor
MFSMYNHQIYLLTYKMRKMEKKLIVEQLVKKVTAELEKINQAYVTTKNLVQNGDLKSDGKHDTRGTEVNYLADGQRKRIAELEQELELLGDIPTKDQKENAVIAIGSLVEIDLNGNIRKYFIAPTAGGTMLAIDGEAILVISVFSPIGSEALGLSINDTFEIELKGDNREYLIKDIN